MKKTAINIAVCAGLSMMHNGYAGSLEERLAAMEERLQFLENRLKEQDEIIQQQEKIISEDKLGSKWVSNVEIGGVIEVEAQNVSTDGDNDSSDIYVATAELGMAARLNDWVASELVLLYEDEGDHSGEFNVDTAAISIADPDSNWVLTAGQFVVPFGVFETNLLSDPLTLEMGETPDAAIMLGFENNGFNASAYVFNGVSDDGDDEINDIGFTVGYATGNETMSFAAQLGYMNNLANTDGVAVDSVMDDVPAWTASVMAGFSSFSFIGEYLAATDQFDASELSYNGNGAEPKAWNLELAYSFPVSNMEGTFAIGVQGTEEAAGLDLPEDKTLLAFSLDLFENTSFTIEYAREEAYDGTDSNVITGQLGYEF